MTTKQVINLAATFLGLDDFLECSYFLENDEEMSDNSTQILNQLVRCLNLVVDEIATEYLPIYAYKKIVLTNGEFAIKEIDPNINCITKITNSGGHSVAFKILQGNIVCCENDVMVWYKKTPQKATKDGEVETFANLLSERILGYGVAMEYSFLNNSYDDATIWESRYKQSLLNIARKKKELKLKERKWF